MTKPLAVMPDPVRVAGFKGVNNRLDPTAMGLEWQLDAIGVLCDDAAYLIQQPDAFAARTLVADGFATRSGRLFVSLTDNSLCELGAAGETLRAEPSVTGPPFHWINLGIGAICQNRSR